MLELVLGIIGMGVGITTGAVIKTTEKGRQVDENLGKTWELWNNDVKTKVSGRDPNLKLK